VQNFFQIFPVQIKLIQIYEKIIKKKIRESPLKKGQRLAERGLLATFGCSFTPKPFRKGLYPKPNKGGV